MQLSISSLQKETASHEAAFVACAGTVARLGEQPFRESKLEGFHVWRPSEPGRRNWLAALVLLMASLAPAPLVADGLPYYQDRMTRPFVGLLLSEAQVKEISATGLVTLDDGNLKLIRRFYSQFPRKVAVASSTFNDNLERDGDCPDVIWWCANEVRVTLIEPDKVGALSMEEEVQPWTPSPLLRLSPKAEIHHEGQQISFSRALEIIESEAAKAVPRQDYRIILPPHYASGYEVEFDPSKLDPAVRKLLPEELDIEKHDFNYLVRTLFDRLVAHGEARGLLIHKSW
jgi:hypothetical protein